MAIQIHGVPLEKTGRHGHIKVSISTSRMDITLGPSLLSLEYLFIDVTSLGIKLH